MREGRCRKHSQETKADCCYNMPTDNHYWVLKEYQKQPVTSKIFSQGHRLISQLNRCRLSVLRLLSNTCLECLQGLTVQRTAKFESVMARRVCVVMNCCLPGRDTRMPSAADSDPGPARSKTFSYEYQRYVQNCLLCVPCFVCLQTCSEIYTLCMNAALAVWLSMQVCQLLLNASFPVCRNIQMYSK